MDLLRDIEQAYAGFAPRHQHHDDLAGGVIVYTMNNLGGACIFFTSAYYNTPDSMARPDRAQLFSTYSSLLHQLRRGLPRRFHSTLDALIPQVPILFDESWPLVPHHVDLLENNIHVDKITGRMLGICDWRGAEVGPFGISLGGLETMLGVRTTSGDFWRYHPNFEELEHLFWDRLFYYLGGERGVSDVDKERIRVARLVGLFLANGFQNGVAATEESEDLRFLGAVVLR
ncbi:hypothetical protein SPBR_08641 [Sporothrix brasiliensis 5110]|uniref:Aminoglycoside phosphotransferase domain-containing protein n=1 Tax=Sporothrix brasiliensis 5110 TaxID=1398154 RepID=A0A0C2ELA2_9PEZI|nr:uncharacterized protein SPBR_08641 [Sporothrix brasiliensis 5110]KIH86874.1 hypothetical protein SPBR_08641 [Sporothrix brasiliensis 5110]